MNAPVRLRLGLVHLETNRDFLQIPGTYPDEEDLEDEELIQQQHAQGIFDLRRLVASLVSPLAIEEQKLRDSCWFNSRIKRQRVILKTKQNSPATVETNLQKLEYANFPASIRVLISLCWLAVSALIAQLRTDRCAQRVSQAHLRHRELSEAAARPQPNALVGSGRRG